MRKVGKKKHPTGVVLGWVVWFVLLVLVLSGSGKDFPHYFRVVLPPSLRFTIS
jgi:hypothetical protein